MNLEITYRDGRPRVGYLYLCDPREKSGHSRRISAELVIDINKDGQLIGVELLDPRTPPSKLSTKSSSNTGSNPSKNLT